MLRSRGILFSKQIYPEKRTHSHCYMYLSIIGVHRKFPLSLNKSGFLEEKEGSSRAHALAVFLILFVVVVAMAQMLAPQRKEAKNLKSCLYFEVLWSKKIT